jgi:hypothetical protein
MRRRFPGKNIRRLSQKQVAMRFSARLTLLAGNRDSA